MVPMFIVALIALDRLLIFARCRYSLIDRRQTLHPLRDHVLQALRSVFPSNPEPLHFSVSLQEPHGASSGGQRLEVHIGGIHAAIIWVWIQAWWYLYCEAAIRARIPVLAGLAAELVLCWKIIRQ